MHTIKDVAKMAGTSISTVSRVLNNKPVRQENHERITAAMEKLNYRVNNSARSLKLKKTHYIGAVVNTLDMFYYMRILKHTQNYLQQYGYSMIIVDTDFSAEREKEQVQRFVDMNVDGLVVHIHNDSCSYLKDIAPGVPLVVMDKIPDDYICDTVVCDSVTVVYKAISQFITNGHRRIAAIVGPQETFPGRDRLMGFTRAMSDFCVPINQRLIKICDYQTEKGYEAMKELLAMKADERPTAVFASSYYFTLGASRAMQELGVKIPEEISFIGYDMEELHDFYSPKIHMIIEDYKELGTQIGRLLLKQLNGDQKQPELVRTTSFFIEGDSIKKIT